ncbi:MAG: response regulator, partial [Ruminococcus sp.]|nr:response regulator [Ruminococcus sp.]
MKRKSRIVTIILVIAIALIAAIAMEIALVFRLTSQQTKESGTYKLEAIGGELEDTISIAKQNVMRLALDVAPYMDELDDGRIALTDYIYKKQKENYDSTGGVCFNTYVGSPDWYIIPDFSEPGDYRIADRSWYKGAVRADGEVYVTDPYIDAMTGNICYTVSIVLDDKKTVVANDYTMESIQRHINSIYKDGNKNAVIVTEEGIIAGCSDESLVGGSLAKEMPDYAAIFSLAKSSDGTVTSSQGGENLFATHSGFGWYLIVSENNWTLYKTSYIQMLAMIGLSMLIFAVVIIMCISSARSARLAKDALEYKEEFLKSISSQLQEPLKKIISASSSEQERTAADYRRDLESIREAGSRLSEKIGEILSYSSIVRGEKELRERQRHSEIRLSKHFRTIILLALMLVMGICVYINITATFRWGKGRMQREVTSYEYQLSEWINTQKSILDMFCTYVSTEPEKLDDYEGAVKWLDDITKQYPEISVTYFTNPDREHTVIMNNGWQPDKDWHVEDRQWYKDTLASDEGWSISSPYYDAQTGVYCMTFSKRVYDDKTGVFLGIFGIDFYMDKLIGIMDNSYSETGYAFLADAGGEIINHPYGSYQMTDETSKNIIELPYAKADNNGENVCFIKDYDGSYKTLIATKNSKSRFTVYVVKDIWVVYRDVLIYGTICFIVLVVCIVIVYKVMTRLIALQDAANEKLRESADAAIAADAAKSSFLAQMSHEIRTPINAVLGMNEMILRESHDEHIKDYAADIQSAGRTLLSLINSILDFSKIEDGKMKIIPAEYDTAAMIHDLVSSIAPRAEAKGLTLSVNADIELPRRLFGDDVRLKQVLMNLLTNAVKYTEKGSVTLTLRPESYEGSKVRLYAEVRDTGIGIREEDIKYLFDSFTRIEEKRNRNIEGTGLGMSIVTKLLEMMGSSLEVESVYGEGSAFSFVIEQGIADDAPMGDYRAGIAAAGKPIKTSGRLNAPTAKVLVTDDNAMNLKVAASLFRVFGIEASLAPSGKKAIELVKSERFDIIFLDHMMPELDGIETLGQMRTGGLIGSDVPVIA